MGRPTSYTEELGDRICAQLSEGKSLVKICEQKDMPSRSTVLLWVVKGERGVETYRVFSDIFARAREAQSEAVMDDILAIADDDSLDIGFTEDGKPYVRGENIKRSKLRIETRLKYAAKMYQRKFGDKVQAELTGKDGGPIETREVSTLEAARKIAFVLRSAAELKGE